MAYNDAFLLLAIIMLAACFGAFFLKQPAVKGVMFAE
jgi:hypothetical protein